MESIWLKAGLKLAKAGNKKFVLFNWRVAVSCVLLVAFCASVLPIPIQTFEIRSPESSEPFPCQSCGCGCKTAEQCWTNCCCYTPSERLAWAKKNNVEPPAYAVLSQPTPKALTTLVKRVVQKRPGETYCGTSCEAGCKNGCDKNSSLVSQNCSTCASKSREAKAKPTNFARSGKKRGYVLSMMAQRCQGKSSVFTLLPWTIPALRPQVMIHEITPTLHVATPTKTLVSIYQQPDTPPPKLLSV